MSSLYPAGAVLTLHVHFLTSLVTFTEEESQAGTGEPFTLQAEDRWWRCILLEQAAGLQEDFCIERLPQCGTLTQSPVALSFEHAAPAHSIDIDRVLLTQLYCQLHSDY